MSYRLGVDVEDVTTSYNREKQDQHSQQVPSTPEDSSIGVLNGVSKICDQSGINLKTLI